MDLIYQVFEIITYHKVTMTEKDALNWEACAWARQHKDRFPIDSRPLRRRALDLQVEQPVSGDPNSSDTSGDKSGDKEKQ